MHTRFTLFLTGTFVALAAALLLANLARATAGPAHVTIFVAQGDEPSKQPEIGSSRRISIPYGIASPLPLLAGGSQVVVTGHGGCPLGETVTIVISITQPATGAAASGETGAVCTGAEERYLLLATTTTSATLQPGPGEACGVATMRSGDEIMEVEEWCRAEPALLVEHDEFLYLPLAAREGAG
jgi:hypothetical protein